jgi:hypothetical protein
LESVFTKLVSLMNRFVNRILPPFFAADFAFSSA